GSGAAGAVSAGGAGSGAGAATSSASEGAAGSSAEAGRELSGAEAHAAKKDLGSDERRMQKLERQTSTLHNELAEHDQSDNMGLAEITAQLREVESKIEGLEERWLELSELLG